MHKKSLIILTAAVLTAAAGLSSFAASGQNGVWEWPGFNGAGYTGTPSGHYYYGWDHVDDDDYDEDDDDDYEMGWRNNPNGWWFQYSDGSWPENSWEFIDGRWYRFGAKGLALTGWFVDPAGNTFYLNPVDDGTYGAMRIGWQLIGGKMYYFNPNSRTVEGRMLVNTTTPDGYQVGPDGALIQ